MGKDHQNLSGEGLILIGRKHSVSLLGSYLKRVIRKLINKMVQNKQNNGQDRTKSSFHRGLLVLCIRKFMLKGNKAMDMGYV